MSAFTAVFFPSPNSPGFPLWHHGTSRNYQKMSDRKLYPKCAPTVCLSLHNGCLPKRNTFGGRREGKRKPQQKPAFPSLLPPTVFLSGLSFPSPPFSHPLPVFAFVRTRRLKEAIARPLYCRDGDPPSAAIKHIVRRGRPLAVPTNGGLTVRCGRTECAPTVRKSGSCSPSN